MAPKLYSLAHAERMLVLLEPVVKELRKVHAETRKLERAKLKIDSLREVDPFEAAGMEERLSWSRGDEERLKAELEQLGVEMENLGRGQVNIYSNYHGHLVYLSWEDGEERIKYWRERHYPFEHRIPILESERSEFTGEPVEEITWEQNMTAGRSGRTGK